MRANKSTNNIPVIVVVHFRLSSLVDPSNDRDVVGNFFDVGIRFNNRLRGCTVSVCCWRQFVNDLGPERLRRAR